LSGCAPKDIAFETVAKQRVIDNHENAVQIEAITSTSAAHVPGLAAEDEAKLQSIDYSKYWALIVIYGSGTDEKDSINNISRQGNVIYVRAEMLPQPEGEPLGSWYQIVRIKKVQIPLDGNATFKLMDQFGQERVAVTQVITP
jgi:hypothetical protein